MAHNEPSHQDLHCLAFCSSFMLTDTPICNDPVSEFKDGRVHYTCRNSGLKGLKKNSLCVPPSFSSYYFYSDDHPFSVEV